MPNYEYKCDHCKLIEEKSLPISKRNHVQFCPKCELPMDKAISLTHLSGFDRYGTSQ